MIVRKGINGGLDGGFCIKDELKLEVQDLLSDGFRLLSLQLGKLEDHQPPSLLQMELQNVDIFSVVDRCTGGGDGERSAGEEGARSMIIEWEETEPEINDAQAETLDLGVKTRSPIEINGQNRLRLWTTGPRFTRVTNHCSRKGQKQNRACKKIHSGTSERERPELRGLSALGQRSER